VFNKRTAGEPLLRIRQPSNLRVKILVCSVKIFTMQFGNNTFNYSLDPLEENSLPANLTNKGGFNFENVKR
jgi:hypothetical protein